MREMDPEAPLMLDVAIVCLAIGVSFGATPWLGLGIALMTILVRGVLS